MGSRKTDFFQSINFLLYTTPVLAFLVFTKPLIIHANACGYGKRGWISQMPTPLGSLRPNEESIEDSKKLPMAYISKYLTETQLKWRITERETYAIIRTGKAFLPYLYGVVFTFVIDHRPLEYLMKEGASYADRKTYPVAVYVNHLKKWNGYNDLKTRKDPELQEITITTHIEKHKKQLLPQNQLYLPIWLKQKNELQIKSWIFCYQSHNFKMAGKNQKNCQKMTMRANPPLP